jgi:ribonuclease HI
MNHAWNVSQPVPREYHASNQTAELFALLVLLRQATEHAVPLSDLDVYTDSRYCIDCVTKWMDGWRARGWRKANGEPVVHARILVQVHTLLSEGAAACGLLRMHHVAGHRREPHAKDSSVHAHWLGNKMADYLAGQATASNPHHHHHAAAAAAINHARVSE